MEAGFWEYALGTLKFTQTKAVELAGIFALSSEAAYSKGAYIYNEGDAVSAFFLLVEGKVEVNKATDKYGYKIFGVLHKGDLLGIPELYLEEHCVNALCLTECTLLKVGRETYFSEIVPKYHGFIADLFRQSSRMLAEMQRAICMESAELRLLTYIHYHMVNFGIRVDRGIYIKKTQSNEKIAGILNITRETLSRSLSDLRRRNLLEAERDHFVVLDPDGLNALLITERKLAGFYGSSQ